MCYNMYIFKRKDLKMKLILTVGISASGKTTWAEKQKYEHTGNSTININRDDIRFNIVQPGSDWSTYKFTKANEKRVTEIEMGVAEKGVKFESNIIISNTNLNPKTREFWKKFAEKHGYEFEIKEFPITLEEAIKRDNLRQNGVGEQVIRKQYQQWLEYIGRKTYVPNENAPKCIIVDIDGTVAEMNGRKPFEWNKVDTDLPRQFVIDIVTGYADKHNCNIVFLSGRDGCCYDKTRDWLDKYIGNDVQWILSMRAEKDNRKDSIVKEEIFWNIVAPNYNVIGVFDDRPQVLQMWHELKLPNVICVGNPFISF